MHLTVLSTSALHILATLAGSGKTKGRAVRQQLTTRTTHCDCVHITILNDVERQSQVSSASRHCDGLTAADTIHHHNRRRVRCSTQFLSIIVVVVSHWNHATASNRPVGMRHGVTVTGAVNQTPRAFAELINSGVVKQDVGNGNHILAERKHGKRCAKTKKK